MKKVIIFAVLLLGMAHTAFAGQHDVFINYSSSLNAVFTVLTSGTYIIEIQGDGWYAEGEIEVE